MQTSLSRGTAFRPSLSLLLLGVLFGALWLAGGASRADAAGQVLVRGASWFLLLILALFAERPTFRREWPVLALLGAAVALPLFQLVPLPPAVWQSLPGRDVLVRAAVVAGEPQPWRPWAIVPGAALNAASSLIVPITTLMLVAGLRDAERALLPAGLLAAIVASMFVGLLQFSGIKLDNSFINDAAGDISGTFANRNHFAIFLAIGCLLAPVWAFPDGRQAGWRAPIALGLVLLFALMILATGSRAGLVAGLVAMGIALPLVRHGLRRAFSGAPRWLFPAITAAIMIVLAIFIFASFAADRAKSIDRALGTDVGTEMRGRALPTVLDMIGTYFPAGSGMGGFDPIFRLHEPFAFLTLFYFNHAHNDFLEVILDAGLPGLSLLIAAIAWWVRTSIRAWQGGVHNADILARLGSGILLLMLLASLVDYPVRTPILMAVSAVAAVWLCGRPDKPSHLLYGHRPRVYI